MRSGGRTDGAKVRRWPGGHIHRTKDGRDLYIIERKVGTRRFHVSTRCHGYDAAMKHLERFEADPFSYSPSGTESEAPLALTSELALEFHRWQVEVKGNTRKHANEMLNRIADWTVDLRGVDLRKATMRDHIRPALEKHAGSRQHRIIAIKAFYAWLRREKHLLSHSQDPTLDLAVPSPRPAKLRRRKTVPRRDVMKVLSKLKGSYRDCLMVLANSGMHVTELERLVRGRDSDVVRQNKKGAVAIVSFRHKTGDMHSIALSSRPVLEALLRLRKRGEVPRRFSGEVKRACRLAKVEEFGPGVMRHSYATWAVEEGVSPADVSRALGHKDQRTSRRFYIDTASTAVVVPVKPVLTR